VKAGLDTLTFASLLIGMVRLNILKVLRIKSGKSLPWV